MDDDVECLSCRAVAGEIVLTNAPRLELDQHWRIEHAHPVAVAGWLVLVLRRHARALHELTDAESAALGRWLTVVPKALHHATGSELEYVMQFAEDEGFHHIHVHLIARMPGWNPAWRGPRVFGALGSHVADPISGAQATEVVELVGAYLGIAPTAVPAE
jgi:diadenosine tetraphosphate (Ap4A) HIT family hydrolase